MALGTALGTMALAQSSTTTYITDINGNRVEASALQSSDHTRAERRQSVNGSSVSLEQIEEHVIREDASGKVTERIVKKFSPTGDLASTERIVTEEQKTAGGSSVQQTTWRSDVNGSLREAERRTTETHGTGANTSSETVIARPTVNGSFETAEKRAVVTSGTDANKQTNESVYRLSQNGGMVEALRQVTVSTKKGDQTTANTSYYEPDVSGALDLARQSVSTTTKHPDGSELTEVNLFARSIDGRLQENGAPQQIKEQQIIGSQKNPDGSVTESLSVRRPSLADPTQLGNVQKISDTVCTGKCD